jgi:choline dehydrogenase-like flavoprotein
VRWRLGKDDAATARRALVEMARLARAGGALEVMGVATPPPRWASNGDFDTFLRTLSKVDTGPNRLSVFSAHQMGTARAGADRRLHPCDPWGAVRGVAGLSVADGSLFPTASGVNPMLTVMVLAARVAGRIASET